VLDSGEKKKALSVIRNMLDVTPFTYTGRAELEQAITDYLWHFRESGKIREFQARVDINPDFDSDAAASDSYDEYRLRMAACGKACRDMDRYITCRDKTRLMPFAMHVRVIVKPSPAVRYEIWEASKA